MKSVDPILDADLDAYVDDQLDVARRIEVEAYLSEHPTIAARVMANLRVQDELRLALAEYRPHVRQATREAARNLERALSRRKLFSLFQRAAAVALFVGAGWLAHAYVGPFGAGEVVASVHAPAFVDEALKAHSTTVLRGTMPSQPETGRYDAADIRSATGIVLPELPRGWSVSDVQVFPSAFGPSVEMAVARRDGEHLSLFAVRPGDFTVRQVLVETREEINAAYWQIGEVAYALVSDGEKPEVLAETARRLARTLY